MHVSVLHGKDQVPMVLHMGQVRRGCISKHTNTACPLFVLHAHVVTDV